MVAYSAWFLVYTGMAYYQHHARPYHRPAAILFQLQVSHLADKGMHKAGQIWRSIACARRVVPLNCARCWPRSISSQPAPLCLGSSMLAAMSLAPGGALTSGHAHCSALYL